MLKYMNGTADIGKLTIPKPFQNIVNQAQQTGQNIYNSVVPQNIQQQIQAITPNTVNINTVLAGKVFLASVRANFMGLADKVEYLLKVSPSEVTNFWKRYGSTKNLVDAVNAGRGKKAFGYVVGDKIGNDCLCKDRTTWAAECCKGFKVGRMGADEEGGGSGGTDWAQYAKVALPIIQWIVSLFNKKKDGGQVTQSEATTLDQMSAALATYAAGAKDGTARPYVDTSAPDQDLATSSSEDETPFYKKPLNIAIGIGLGVLAYKKLSK